MKLKKALERFDYMDKVLQKSVFSKEDLRIAFREDSERALNKSIARLIDANVIERAVKGVYTYNYGRSMQSYPIENIARAIRPFDALYVSLESALSEYGLISQILISHITIITSGRSGTYKTTKGTIEFTHTNCPLELFHERMIDVEGRPLAIATQVAALADLKRVGRNMTMVNENLAGEAHE